MLVYNDLIIPFAVLRLKLLFPGTRPSPGCAALLLQNVRLLLDHFLKPLLQHASEMRLDTAKNESRTNVRLRIGHICARLTKAPSAKNLYEHVASLFTLHEFQITSVGTDLCDL